MLRAFWARVKGGKRPASASGSWGLESLGFLGKMLGNESADGTGNASVSMPHLELGKRALGEIDRERTIISGTRRRHSQALAGLLWNHIALYAHLYERASGVILLRSVGFLI